MEQNVMQMQKRINKLQVEHVSEEEVDQLFYALEKKEEELAAAQKQRDELQEEVLTARGQLSARGNPGEPKFIEIHHHNTLSDDDSDDDEKKA